jgi:CTD nuclear envelope phosphatase 1
VEPDLSKVMILDNSPLSYMFHQGMFPIRRERATCWVSGVRARHRTGLTTTGTDNAIPIQGWISDPTDNELVHLVPLLEGLQYVSDVRALLALRGGEMGNNYAERDT